VIEGWIVVRAVIGLTARVLQGWDKVSVGCAAKVGDVNFFFFFIICESYLHMPTEQIQQVLIFSSFTQ
jgi:hypothetical protein